MIECEHRFVTKGRRVTYCKNCEELRETLRRDEEIEALKAENKEMKSLLEELRPRGHDDGRCDGSKCVCGNNMIRKEIDNLNKDESK